MFTLSRLRTRDADTRTRETPETRTEKCRGEERGTGEANATGAWAAGAIRARRLVRATRTKKTCSNMLKLSQ